jgi:hypothetical protein
MLSGLTALLLILADCGQSSTGKSTQSSTGKSTQSSTGKSTQASTGQSSQQSSAGTSTSPPSAISIPRASGTVTGFLRGVTATLHAGTRHPKVGRPWPIRFTVTRGGRAARAGLSYQYLFGGQVVAHTSHYTFTGHFLDVFRWPSSAAGYPLTLRAVIVSEGATIDLDYPVQVTR